MAHTGSHTIKAGFAGDDKPKVEIETVVDGRRSIQVGVITNINGMETLWKQVFEKLRVKSEDCTVLMTEPPLNPKANREQTVKIMFEQFKVKGLSLAVDGFLALHSTGNSTGLVVDFGHDKTAVIPVYDGDVMSFSLAKMDVGFSHLPDGKTKFPDAYFNNQIVPGKAENRYLLVDIMNPMTWGNYWKPITTTNGIHQFIAL